MANYPISFEHKVYEIRFRGQLEERRAHWFASLTMTRLENGETLLKGKLSDSAALHGVLNRIRDLGLELISVQRVEENPADAASTATGSQENT